MKKIQKIFSSYRFPDSPGMISIHILKAFRFFLPSIISPWSLWDFLGCLEWSSPVLLDERVWKMYCEFRAGTKLQVTKLTVLVAAEKQGGWTFKSGTCTFLSWKAYHGVSRSFSILSFNSLNSATLTQIEAELFSSRNFSEHLLDTKCLGPFITSTIYQMKLSQLKYSFQSNRHRGALCS